jgi:hypothetical protein
VTRTKKLHPPQYLSPHKKLLPQQKLDGHFVVCQWQKTAKYKHGVGTNDISSQYLVNVFKMLGQCTDALLHAHTDAMIQ